MNNGSERIEKMFDRYGDEILRTCMLMLRDRALAEDAAMTVYENAFSSLHRFRGDSSERTWLIKIAMNTCRSIMRSSAYRTSMNGEPPETPAEGDDFSAAETKAAVSGAIMSLPEIYRQAAVLSLYNGLTVKEAARLAGVTQSAMAFRVRKAKELLREALRECYYD